jgi:hypothetical protein
LSAHDGASSLTIVVFISQEHIMISRTARIFAIAGIISFASFGHAGTSTISPSLAACSKALIQTLAKTETLPTYVVKPASNFVADMVDPHAFTVIAKDSNKKLIAKASCKATPKGDIVSLNSIPLKS